MPDKEFFEDDPFWSIENLTPKSKTGKQSPPRKTASPGPVPPRAPAEEKTAPASPDVRTPAASEGTAQASPRPSPGSLTDRRDRRSGAFPLSGETPEKRYEYTSGPVREVEIYTWPNTYSFFGAFRKNALTVLHMSGEPCPYEPFFSFMPQYHQLTAKQLKYYLYWRQSFQNGTVLRADFCYLLLYAYEIINLPDEIPPARGADLLARLWRDYRKAYPKLDKYLSEWLEDYCFIHGVRPQKTLFEAVAPFGRRSDAFREFYVSDEEAAQPGLLLSDYFYKNSKYLTEENRALFEKHIPAAMAAFFKTQKTALPSKESLQKTARTSYDGAVCAYSQKKRILLTYLPLRMSDAAMQVTDAVRLCENYVRAYLGIRGRLATPSLTPQMKAAIENYFKKNLPTRALEMAAREEEINARYEPEDHGFSDEAAKEIERRSLFVADRLGSVFEKELPEEKPSPPQKKEPTNAGLAETAKDQCKELLAVLVTGGSEAFISAARERNKLPHSLMDAINEEAIARYGDVALEEINGVFTPIEDYRKEIEEWITN